MTRRTAGGSDRYSDAASLGLSTRRTRTESRSPPNAAAITSCHFASHQARRRASFPACGSASNGRTSSDRPSSKRTWYRDGTGYSSSGVGGTGGASGSAAFLPGGAAWMTSRSIWRGGSSSPCDQTTSCHGRASRRMIHDTRGWPTWRPNTG